jgi:hypothetical protein
MTVEIMPGFTLTDIETRGARIRAACRLRAHRTLCKRYRFRGRRGRRCIPRGDETGFIASALRSAVVPVMIVSRRHRTVGIAAQRIIPRDLLGRPCGAAKSF